MACIVHKNYGHVFEANHSVTVGFVPERIFFVLLNQLSHATFITFLVIFIYLYLHDVCQMLFCKE